MNILLYTTITLNVVLLISLAIILKKIWRVVSLLYRIRDTVEKIHNTELHALSQQLQYLENLKRRLKLSGDIPITRGWAASPDFLVHVFDTIAENKPKVVVEASSGSSTVVIARALELNGRGHVYSLESNPIWAEETRRQLAKNDLGRWGTVLDAPLLKQKAESEEVIWYDATKIPKEIARIDLLVIDGPPIDTAPLARYPALPLMQPLLGPGSRIILDDAGRTPEQVAVKRWKERAPSAEFKWLYLEKGGIEIIWH